MADLDPTSWGGVHKAEALLRFMDKVEPEPMSGCWLWSGPDTGQGYGSFYRKDRKACIGAHRVAWELFRGPIPEGLQIDHLCRVRCCVNPDHLEPVTPRVNTLRSFAPTAINLRKTVCVRGHSLLDPENVRTMKRRDGTRRNCRVCQATVFNGRFQRTSHRNAYQRTWRAARRAASALASPSGSGKGEA